MASSKSEDKCDAEQSFANEMDRYVDVSTVVFEEGEGFMIDKYEPKDMPTFKGGSLVDFQKWVIKQLKKVKWIRKSEKEGYVIVSFVIGVDGFVSNVEHEHGYEKMDKVLINEVIRMVLSSPKWTPRKDLGENVSTKYTIPVPFPLK